ncbi:hypothetical protein J6590_013276 [Homalodisca vitripennis]|nr:hypothetical protein J6590_013276 [Homalodisca vitripennis]
MKKERSGARAVLRNARHGLHSHYRRAAMFDNVIIRRNWSATQELLCRDSASGSARRAESLHRHVLSAPETIFLSSGFYCSRNS